MFWGLLKPRKELVVRKSDVESYCDQMASHVREILKYKILMDDATKRLCEIDRTTPYECKEYARAIEKSNKAHSDFKTYMGIWSIYVDILKMLILPNVSIIIDVDNIKYKVTHEHGKLLGFYINIERMK